MNAIARYPDWRARLTAYLAAGAREPFAYGRHDCALFAAGAVAAMTGIDLAAPFRGRYRSLRGGLRVMRAAGYADHVALAAAHLPACDPARALPGDLAVFDTPDGRALGVVQGPGVYVLGPSGALSIMPRTAASGALTV